MKKVFALMIIFCTMISCNDDSSKNKNQSDLALVQSSANDESKNKSAAEQIELNNFPPPSIMIWEIYSNEDMSPMIRGYLKNYSNPFDPRAKAPLIVGFGQNKPEIAYALFTDTASVTAGLIEYAKENIPSMKAKLTWTYNPTLLSVDQNQTGSTHGLYALKTPKGGWSKSLLTNHHMQNAEVMEEGNRILVKFEFNEKASAVWAKLSEKVARKRSRGIAITYKGLVLIAPPIKAPIKTGKYQFDVGASGNSKAKSLAKEIVEIMNNSEAEK